jgi:hypothetical protein
MKTSRISEFRNNEVGDDAIAMQTRAGNGLQIL